MKRISSRIKRMHGISTQKYQYEYFHPKKGVNRPKTYASEASAHAAAKKKGLAESKYTLKRVKKEKRFQIVKV